MELYCLLVILVLEQQIMHILMAVLLSLNDDIVFRSIDGLKNNVKFLVFFAYTTTELQCSLYLQPSRST